MRLFVETEDGFLAATPLRIVCHDERDGEWTIDVESVGGQCLRDAWGNHPASAWIDSPTNRARMAPWQAIAAARGLRRQMEMPTLPIYVSRDCVEALVEEQATGY